MKALGGRNLILPKLSDFEKMGLRRSNKFDCLTYPGLLNKLQIDIDPLRTGQTDFAKKVYDYACNELFIVPKAHPQQNENPVIYRDGVRPLELGNEGFLEHFAQFLYTDVKLEIPADGSLRTIIEQLDNLWEEPNDEAIKKIMEWTHRYGLLFTEPMPENLLENLYSKKYLTYSDAVYRGICAEYSNVPYFLGVKAFCELNRYTLNLLFVAWLFSQENELLGNNDPETAKNAIIDSYRMLNPAEASSIDEMARTFLGNDEAENTRYQRIRYYALRNLAHHLAVWTKLEAVPEVKVSGEIPETLLGFIYLGEVPREWATSVHYQCSSLFGAMMMEALGRMNKESRYRICPQCNKVFDIGSGRSNRKYCSDGTQSEYENCKGFSRYARERQKRAEKKANTANNR